MNFDPILILKKILFYSIYGFSFKVITVLRSLPCFSFWKVFENSGESSGIKKASLSL